MKTAFSLPYVLAAAGVLAAAQLPPEPSYDRSSEMTIKGTVRAMRQEKNVMMGKGTHLTVRTEDGRLHDVYLGPKDYVRQQEIKINRGDDIEITGSRSLVNGETVMLAREVQHDGRTFALRSAEGAPQWGTADRATGAERRASGHMHGAMVSTPAYDPATETTIRGSIDEVKTVSGMPESTHAVVRTEDGRRITVQLAPRDYLAGQQLSLKKGDQVEITGSRVQFGDKEGILARQVSTGGRTFTLRSAEGTPQWTAPSQP